MVKNTQIEGLRAIGVAMIVLFHYIYRFNELYGDTSNLMFFSQWGTIGVGLFFLLSGYFMFAVKNTEKESLLQYCVRKIKRLYVPYLPAVVIIFVITSLMNLPGRTTTVVDLLLNAILINGFIGTDYVDTAHWYLTYLISFTVLAGIAKKTKIRIVYIIPSWLFFALLIRFPIGRIPMPSTLSHFLQVISGGANIYPFLLGAILANIEKYNEDNEELHLGDYIILGICAAYSIYNIFTLYNIVISISIVTSIILIALCVDMKLPFLSVSPLQMIAKVSYPLYLIHQNIGYVVLWGLKDRVEYPVAIIVAIIISSLLAVILYYYEYFGKLRKRKNVA